MSEPATGGATRTEITRTAKRLGVGTGLFGGAGPLAVLGPSALLTAVILGPAHALPGWPAAVLVGAVLLAVARVLALIGKENVRQAAPPLPTETISGVQDDVAAGKEGLAR